MTPDAYTQLLEQARKHGATVTMTGGGHWRIAQGDKVVFASQTPSDTRAVANLRALLRRHELLPRPRSGLTEKEQEIIDRCIQAGRGVRFMELPPKRLLDKGFLRIAKRSQGWMVWATEKARTTSQPDAGTPAGSPPSAPLP